MKQALLILSVLGMGIAQANGAVETTFQPNNTSTHITTNISSNASYGSSRNIYSTNSGAHVSSNDEISQAIENLSAHAKQKEYQLASLTSRLSYEQRKQQASMAPDRYSAPAIAAANASRVALSRRQRQMHHVSLYLEALAIVLAMYAKHYSLRVMNLRLILQRINMPLAAR